MNCPLCGSLKLREYAQDKERSYHFCQDCSLIFVPRSELLSSTEEKKRYDLHHNEEDDPRYREYLTKVSRGVLPFLSKASRGLDFGCGSSTLLSKIIEEQGHVMSSYDLYYHPHEELLKGPYDFIILSEVIEHLASPYLVMEKLKATLTPAGQFFIKTRFYPQDPAAFANWYYKKDPTHIQFFDEGSMRKLAQALGMIGPFKTDVPDLYRLGSK